MILGGILIHLGIVLVAVYQWLLETKPQWTLSVPLRNVPFRFSVTLDEWFLHTARLINIFIFGLEAIALWLYWTGALSLFDVRCAVAIGAIIILGGAAVFIDGKRYWWKKRGWYAVVYDLFVLCCILTALVIM